MYMKTVSQRTLLQVSQELYVSQISGLYPRKGTVKGYIFTNIYVFEKLRVVSYSRVREKFWKPFSHIVLG